MAAPAKQYTWGQNLIDRGTLLNTGIKMRTRLGTFGPFTMGQMARIKLRNVGIITGLKMFVYADCNPTTVQTLSPLAPYNLVQQLIVSDYNTTQRLNLPGHMLAFILSARNNFPWLGYSGATSIDSNQIGMPAGILNGQTKNLFFPLDVPVCYDPVSDLTGAILAQTVVGEQYLSIQFQQAANATNAGDPLFPFTNTAGGVIANIYAEVYQDY